MMKKLGIKVEELIRRKEPLFKEKYAGKKFTEKQWLEILVKNPVLIERPIVVKDKVAVIGRPPENVKILL